jgi:N-acetylmuramoyl-L-alanine amidase
VHGAVLEVGLDAAPALLVPGDARSVLPVLCVFAPLAAALRRRISAQLAARRARDVAGVAHSGSASVARIASARLMALATWPRRTQIASAVRRCVTLRDTSGGIAWQSCAERASRRLGAALVALAHRRAAPRGLAESERFDTVVIDAGHGGSDVGAKGFSGTFEKDVALAVARNLAARLRARGLKVVMTRDADVRVPLEQRTAIANDTRGDLFVSIHANASPDTSIHGSETTSSRSRRATRAPPAWRSARTARSRPRRGRRSTRSPIRSSRCSAT